MRSKGDSRKIQGKVGLALGSGSARGWAHIGVIRALAEEGIKVDFIAGTSMGAVVGAVFASGNIDSLEEVALELDWKRIAFFFDVILPKSGLIDGTKVSDFIRKHVEGINIEELPVPYCAVSTDLMTGKEVVIRNGDIIEAVRASISVPGIFTPAQKDGMILVDGALVNPVPVSVVRGMGADFVIAVDLNYDIVSGKRTQGASDHAIGIPRSTSEGEHIPEKKHKLIEIVNSRIASVDIPSWAQIKKWKSKEQLPSIFEVLVSSINIMEAQIAETNLKFDPPDLLIRPNLGHIKFLEFNRAKETIAEGYREARVRIEGITGKGGSLGAH